MNYINYKIKGKNGMFYTTSKTKEEGYFENKYIDKKTGEEVINFHKEVKSLEGELVFKALKDSQFGTNILLLLKQDDETTLALQMPILNARKGVDDYAKSLSCVLTSLQNGKTLKLGLNSTKKDKAGYLYKNIYVEIEGEKAKIDFKYTDEIVPKGIEVTNKVTGKKNWDYSDSDSFYYKKLQTFLGSIQQEETTEPEIAPAKTTTVKTKQPIAVVNDDDLPF